MPELPEVESVRRVLQKQLPGQTVRATEVYLPKIIAGKGANRKHLPVDVTAFQEFCRNKQISKISRRAKNLLLTFTDESLLLIHFKMSGQLLWVNTKEAVSGEKYVHVLWELDKGYLLYKDLRQFGYVLPYPSSAALREHFADLGMEPFGVEYEYATFAARLKKKQGVLKKVFLDQSVVVGLGNIYADEVCHYARVKPTRKAATLKKKELEDLYRGIREILSTSISVGGTTKYTHTLPDGEQGRYKDFLQVYGRGGEKCFRDGNPLTKAQVAGRTTVWCEKCQK